ncbi:hypothetical protein, partial [Pelomonas sp. KK5]|uniref:hypothetical protein n=1 Tax=Pelomonas sp. KK5 TaxID=1855730 RepID=UPI00117FAFD8
MTTEPQTAPNEAPKPSRRRRWRLALALTVLPLSALAVLAIGTTWLLKNEKGSAWLLRQLPGLQVEAPRGPLLGDFAARRVLLTLPGDGGRITIDGLQWQGLTVAWSQSPQLWGRIAMERLHADTVDVALAPSKDSSPVKAPTSLAVPLGLKVAALDLGTLQLSALPGRPFTGLRGSVDLSGDEGAQHRVKIDALQWEQLRLAGQARIATGGKMNVEAALVLQPGQVDPSLPDWRGGLTITGPLADLQIQAKSEAAGQALQAQARLQAFAKWPLAGFSAQVAALDLSALMKDLPKTALSGDVRLDSQGWSEPAKVQLQFSNAAAGRWDQQRLPVQKLSLALQARPDQPRSLRLEALDAQLGSAKAPAGRITGEGTLQPDQRWTLTARLDGVRPEALDQRAAPMLLSGRVDLAGATDLAAPLTLTAKLSGKIPAAPPLAIDAAARLEGRHLRIEQARVESGSSKLVLSGQAQLEDAGWRAEAKTALKDFDPRLFVAGAPGSAWRKGATALNAEGSLTLQRDAASGPMPRGQASLQLLPSKLMGLPIGGKLEYNAAGKADASLSAQLDAGENHLLAITQLGTLPQLSTQLELQAPKLADAAALIELLTGARIAAGAAEGKAGLQVQKTADGRWLPAGDGVFKLQDLRVTAPTVTTLKEARLRWSFGSKPDSALALNLQVERLGSAGQELKQASVDLQGSWASHKLKFAAQAQPSRGPVADLTLNLDGVLSGSPLLALQDGKPLDWQAKIAQLELKSKT